MRRVHAQLEEGNMRYAELFVEKANLSGRWACAGVLFLDSPDEEPRLGRLLLWIQLKKSAKIRARIQEQHREID